MTVVLGTAGHIDHGKTALLRALTGMDADRLPEEQRRGMTIDVGYAHLRLPDGDELDFVDVPGHDRLIGNMLVGAGEIDAALLVVAADDGPRAQTLEHLELLDALRIEDGIVVVTKTDLVDGARRTDVVEAVGRLLRATSLARAPIVAVSSISGEGLDALRAELVRLRDRVRHGPEFDQGPTRLAIDRVFTVRGRGVVVTGTLRGRTVRRGDQLRVEPGGRTVRVREIQIHNRTVEEAEGGGRVALNLVGAELEDLRRGLVLTTGTGIEATDRLLAALWPAIDLTSGSHRDADLRHGSRVRVHLGTDQIDATLDLGRRAAAASPDGGTTAILRLYGPVATLSGDRFVVRRPSPGETLAGGRVLDPLPPRGISRRRIAAPSLVALATAKGNPETVAAVVELHGLLPVARAEALAASEGLVASDGLAAAAGARRLGPALVAGDLGTWLEERVIELVGASDSGISIAELRRVVAAEIRRRVTVQKTDASALIDALVTELAAAGDGRLRREGERLRVRSASSGPSPELLAAMDRLEAALGVASPPGLAEAARAATCPPEGIRALEAAGRIVRVEDDLAWSATLLRRFESLALALAASGPVSPAAYRDATGTSRRYALAILEDLDRRAILRRTPAGHVRGPRAPAAGAAASST